MINSRITLDLETPQNPFNLKSSCTIIEDLDNESNCCISEAENYQINDLISFDQQLTFLKQFEANEASYNNFSSCGQDIHKKDLLIADMDIHQCVTNNIEAENSSIRLNIDDSGANSLNLCFLIHDDSDQDEKLHINKDLNSSLKERSLVDQDDISSTKSKNRIDKISQNDSDDNFKQQEKTIKRRDLHKRSDVISKAMIRLIRKLFRVIYNNESFKKGKVKKALKLKQYKALVNTVVSQLLGKSSFSTLKGQDRCKIFEIIGRMINTSLFSKLPKLYKSEDTEEIKSFITKFNQCCKAFKLSTYSEVVNSEYFNIVLDIFISNGGENFIKEQNKNTESIDLICKSLKHYARN